MGNSIAAYGMVGEVDAHMASPVGQGLVETFDGDQALARTYVELGVLDGSIDTGMPSPIGEGGRAMVDDILATANGVRGQAPTDTSVNSAMAGGLPLTGTVRESVERADELTAGRMADIQQGIDDRLQDAMDAHGEGVAAQHVANHQAIQAESAARHDRAEEGFGEFEQRQNRMAAEQSSSICRGSGRCNRCC